MHPIIRFFFYLNCGLLLALVCIIPFDIGIDGTPSLTFLGQSLIVWADGLLITLPFTTSAALISSLLALRHWQKSSKLQAESKWKALQKP